MAALAELLAEPGPLRARAAGVGDPLAVLPVPVAMLCRGMLATGLDPRLLGSASTVGAAAGRAGGWPGIRCCARVTRCAGRCQSLNVVCPRPPAGLLAWPGPCACVVVQNPGEHASQLLALTE